MITRQQRTDAKASQTQDINNTNDHKRSTALERSVKHFTGGLKPLSDSHSFGYGTIENDGENCQHLVNVFFLHYKHFCWSDTCTLRCYNQERSCYNVRSSWYRSALALYYCKRYAFYVATLCEKLEVVRVPVASRAEL